MPVSNEIDLLFRDFLGYTGDGQGNTGTLPVGDRSTGQKRVSNKELRDGFKLLLDLIENPGDPQLLPYRPGENSAGFTYTNTTPGELTEWGTSAISTAQGSVFGAAVAVEDGRALEFAASFFRLQNSPDPANDTVRVGIQWMNSAKQNISTSILLARSGLVVADGRVSVSRTIVDGSVPGGGTFLSKPAGAVYARAFFQTFGSGHRTGCDMLVLRTVPDWVKASGSVPAEGVFTEDPEFEWPEDWIPDIKAETIYTDDPEFEWPEDWIPDIKAETIYTDDPEFEWPAPWIPPQEITNTIFVDYDGGSDQLDNDGASWKNRVKTLERAAELAQLRRDEMRNNGQTSIILSAATHYTNGEVAFPDDTYIRGMWTARSTTIRPFSGGEVRNVFTLGSGSHVEALNSRGWQIDDLDNATKGFLVALRPEALFTRAIWIKDVLAFRDAPASLIPPGLDRANGNPELGPGAGVAICDPMVVSQYSPMPQIMVSGATLVAPNGIGLRAVNGGYINCLYMVPLWARVGFEAVNGGILDLTYCSLQFGDYCLRREGAREVLNPNRLAVRPEPNPTAANAILAQKNSIVNNMWSWASSNGYGGLSEARTRQDGGLFVDAIAQTVRTGDDEPVRWFARRMFRFDGSPIVTPSMRPGFVGAWQNMRDRIKQVSGVTGSVIDQLTAIIIDGVTNPRMRLAPSELNANSFVFRKVGTGVDFSAIEKDPLPIQDTFIDTGPGSINWDGVEQDTGRQFFTGGALVNPRTGQFEGPPVKRTFDPIAAEAALIVGGQF